MKNKLVLFLSLLFLFSCKKENQFQSLQLNCGYTDFIDTNFREGAKFLLITEIIENGSSHPNYNNPYIDNNDVNTVLSALQKIYDLHTLESDTVFNYYHISVFRTNSLHSISIEVDPDAIEVKRLIHNEPTMNVTLDNLISTYQFNDVDTSIFYPNISKFITLNSDLQLNLIPIINTLKTFSFFGSVQYNGYGVGDGNKIIMKRNESNIEFDFSYGYGDCPAGCIYRRHWVFKVDKNCNASFVKRY